jgi:hypothetical protein
MESEKIQILLRKNGKTPAVISRELSISPSVVSRTMNSTDGSSRRVRLYISKIVGYLPSYLFDLSFQDQVLEDYLYCTDLNDSVVSS